MNKWVTARIPNSENPNRIFSNRELYDRSRLVRKSRKVIPAGEWRRKDTVDTCTEDLSESEVPAKSGPFRPRRLPNCTLWPCPFQSDPRQFCERPTLSSLLFTTRSSRSSPARLGLPAGSGLRYRTTSRCWMSERVPDSPWHPSSTPTPAAGPRPLTSLRPCLLAQRGGWPRFRTGAVASAKQTPRLFPTGMIASTPPSPVISSTCLPIRRSTRHSGRCGAWCDQRGGLCSCTCLLRTRALSISGATLPTVFPSSSAAHAQ